ncbi:hypothetical protein, partial [Rhodoplanes roseus]
MAISPHVQVRWTALARSGAGGEQSLNVISHANFLGVDHPGRAYLA